MSEMLIDEVLSSEKELDKLFDQDIQKGIVVAITNDGYKVEDIMSNETVLVTEPDFDYSFANYMFKITEEEESVWVIGYDPVTKVRIEF